jgi:hypothetical protein
MQIVDKKWKDGTYKVFVDVPDELLNFTPNCRVQPAPFFGKRQYKFYLIAKYEPGENKNFPNGGFELRGENSVRYSFEIDQVIVYQDEKARFSKSYINTINSEYKLDAPIDIGKKVCGFVKNDGKECQIKTYGRGYCRFHKN